MKKPKNYLITGITGFVGINILQKLKNKKNINIFYTYKDKKLSLKKSNLKGIKIDLENFKELNKLKLIIGKIDAIIHCANLAHSKYSKEKIQKINYLSSVYLAKLAKIYNVKKFIFLSTAKINMNYKKVFNSEKDISENIKKDFYTYTKYKTENKIIDLLKNSRVKYFILRPALVYGKYAKGNLKHLNNLARLSFSLPLPFLNADQKKTFCSINNLIISIENILIKETESNIFLVCDNIKYSFKDILTEIFKKKKKNLNLFPIRLFLFKYFFYLINKKNIYESIFLKMILNNSKIKRKLNINLNHNLYNTKF